MLWFIVFLVALILEFMTISLISIWFAFGALFALLLDLIGTPFIAQVTVFVIVSVSTLIFTKPYVEKRLLPKDKLEKTNVDALIGKEAVVTVDISNAERKGEVLLEGKYWTARATDTDIIKTSSLVIVERIEGVKVIVSPIKTEEEGVS